MEALGINVSGLMAQIVNFSLLLILLYLVLCKPVLRMLDERRRRIEESVAKAEEIERTLARTQEEYAARMAQARQEAQDIITQAVEIGERLKSEARSQARREAEALLARARRQIELETAQAVAKLREEVADVAILAASRVVRRALDRQTHYQLIEEVLAETERLRVGGESSSQ